MLDAQPRMWGQVLTGMPAGGVYSVVAHATRRDSCTRDGNGHWCSQQRGVAGGRGAARPEPNQATSASFKSMLERVDSGTVRVAPTRTALSGTQASEALKRAYARVTGEEPSRGTLAILTSHWALETGQGQSMYNYNFAGIKGRGPEGMTAVMNTREGYGANTTHIRDGFRAYSSAEDGAVDYISLLQRRYGSALEAAKSEQPDQFVEALKERGYFTGDPELYAKGVTQLANRAMEHGFDALGTTAGDLARRPTLVQPYFDVPSFEPGQRGLPSAMSYDANPLAALGASFDGATTSIETLRDEMSRTALLIAAQRGAV